MRRFSALAFFLIVSAVLVMTVSCGGTMSMGRQLQSITVTPMSANAMNFPSGMVQFSAMGNFNMAPMTASVPVTWSLMGPNSTMAPAGVSINSMTGMAQCSGFMGTVTVMASNAMGSSNMPGSMAVQVVGTAQLTCP